MEIWCNVQISCPVSITSNNAVAFSKSTTQFKFSARNFSVRWPIIEGPPSPARGRGETNRYIVIIANFRPNPLSNVRPNSLILDYGVEVGCRIGRDFGGPIKCCLTHVYYLCQNKRLGSSLSKMGCCHKGTKERKGYAYGVMKEFSISQQGCVDARAKGWLQAIGHRVLTFEWPDEMMLFADKDPRSETWRNWWNGAACKQGLVDTRTKRWLQAIRYKVLIFGRPDKMMLFADKDPRSGTELWTRRTWGNGAACKRWPGETFATLRA